MALIKQTILIDLINTFFITGVFVALFYWLPTATFTLKSDSYSSSPGLTDSINKKLDLVIGSYLRITLGTVVGILALGFLNLLNWLTLSLVYLALLAVNYLESNNWQIKRCQLIIQNKIFNSIDIIDRGLSLKYLFKNLANLIRQKVNQITSYIATIVIRQGTAYIILLTIILIFALLLRWEYPLAELRFSHPDHYNNLLITQQIIAGKYPNINHLPIFPALAAVLSILGSIDAMQAVRFLSPILGIITVLSLGYFVNVLSNNSSSALVAMFSLGIYLFTWEQIVNPELPIWLINIVNSLNNSLVRQWTGNELEIGIISLLLGLGYFYDNQQHRKTIAFKINIFCSLILMAASAPSLLILLAIALLGCFGGRRLVMVGITSSWIILAVFAAVTPEKLIWGQSFLLSLPVALSLLAAILFEAIAKLCTVVARKWAETFCLALAIALSYNFLLPLTPQITYLEYDMAARKTLEIKRIFPRNSWTLAAPVEQLSQIYGSGWYEDLALFVERYSKWVKNPQFNFPFETDLFVFVEKIPFVTFSNEPVSFPNSILGDRTHHYYRSAAGRASLEFEALQMCEAYRQNHPDSQIYFENEELRIYQFKGQKDPDE